MSHQDILLVVKDKFSLSEKVVSVLYNCKLIYPEWAKKEWIWAIVKKGDDTAVFCLSTSTFPPNKFSDLSVETVFPLDTDLKCEIDSKPKNKEVLCLTLRYQKQKLRFEVTASSHVDDFVHTILQGLEAARNRVHVKRFQWLQKYSGIRKGESVTHSFEAVRECHINYEMLIKESRYTYMEQFTIFTATWNVNGKSPVIPLKDWLSVETEAPDIYAIGLQEIDFSKESFIFGETARANEWYKAILASIDDRENYIKVDRVQLVGMMLVVLIKEKFHQHVQNIVCDTVGTGIMSKMGNKGGVSIRFDLHNTSICFINSHLAAKIEELERRNQDFREICNRTCFNLKNRQSQGIKDHDQVYWIGDLNYRITEVDPQYVKDLLDQNKLERLLELDQLTRQCKTSVVFAGYHEGLITFWPTYKYDPGTENWDSSEKVRAPAWCDRVLWKGDNITQISYRSHPTFKISDHKPVSATFKAQIKIVDKEKYRKVYEKVIKKLDKLENELIPQVMVDHTEINFNTVRYLEPQTREITIANTGQVAVQFEFIRKLEEVNFCKEWLFVEPSTKCIYPGEKCDVQLNIFIKMNSACKMNACSEQLHDILVLHLEGGKDIFITVTGSYERSCFGSSIEALCHLNVPIRYVPVNKIMELESLTDQATSSVSTYEVPKELWLLVDNLCRRGLKIPNLFEQPGLHSEILQIRDWLDNGSSGPLPGSVHSVAEALLLLLESTADPIIPFNLHSVCLSASSNYLQCKQIVMQLPVFKKNVFLYICSFLCEVLSYAYMNGLKPKTLASLFGCIILRDTPNKSLIKGPTRFNKQTLNKRKAHFVYHFLVNDFNDVISQAK